MTKNSKNVLIAAAFGTIATFSYSNSLLSITSQEIEQNIVIKDSPASWLYSVPNHMVFETHDPKTCCNQTILLSASLKNVERHIWWNYAICKKFDKHFKPERAGGRGFAGIFKTLRLIPKNYAYIDTDPIIKAYGNPMRWTFDTVEKFRVAKNHFLAKISAPKQDLTQRSVILLEITGKSYTLKDVNESTVLNVDDKEFLRKYFEIPEDLPYIREFFGESLSFFRETTGRVESSGHPDLKYLTMGESIFHYALKSCKELKHEKIIELVLFAAIVFCYDKCKAPSTKVLKKIWRRLRSQPEPTAMDKDLGKVTLGELLRVLTVSGLFATPVVPPAAQGGDDVHDNVVPVAG